MKCLLRRSIPYWLAIAVLAMRLSSAPTVSIAAASNLLPVLEALRAAWIAAEPGLVVTVSSGASGTLFAQITQGAPYDLFLSADVNFPRQLAASGAGDPTSLRIFARGSLALWTLRADLKLDDLAGTLSDPAVKRIALAQPRTAPYGHAAELTLSALGFPQESRGRLVFAENIAQVAQWVATGHADVGFVATSHLKATPAIGRWIAVPSSLHAGEPLEHAAILTQRGAANPAARRCLELLTAPDGAAILRTAGYLPAGR